jgi:hypothetical protein
MAGHVGTVDEKGERDEERGDLHVAGAQRW